jgi:2-oxoisovalerate dehydrogenase E1 component
MMREAAVSGKTLIVDETRQTGGVGEGVLATLLAHGYTGAVDRVASMDSFIPLGDAALEVLLSEETIEAAAIKLAG